MDETQARAQVELLGLVGYASLAAFEQTAAASASAPDVADKLVLARVAAQRFTHVERLQGELERRGSALDAAMQPFVHAVDSFNEHTGPRLWAEALVKLCVVGGLVDDFAAQVQQHLDAPLREILLGSIDDGDLAGEAARMLREALDAEPELEGRLALVARRLLGEALSQAQRIASAHPELTGLLTGMSSDGSGDDLAAISELMAHLAGEHARRMEQLGLA